MSPSLFSSLTPVLPKRQVLSSLDGSSDEEDAGTVEQARQQIAQPPHASTRGSSRERECAAEQSPPPPPPTSLPPDCVACVGGPLLSPSPFVGPKRWRHSTHRAHRSQALADASFDEEDETEEAKAAASVELVVRTCPTAS